MEQQLRDERIRLITGSLLVLAAVAAAGALHFTRGFMIPFVLAAFIATMVSPVVDYQVRHRVPRPLAIFSTILLVLCMLGVVGYLTVLALQAVINMADDYSQNFVDLSAQTIEWLKKANIEIDRAQIGAHLQATLIGVASQTASTVMGMVSTGVLIAIFVVFLLAGRAPVAPGSLYGEIESRVRRYVVAKIGLSAMTGVLVGVILSVMGVRMATVFGMMAFFLNFIPSIGSIIATLLPIPVVVAQFSSPSMWVLAIALPGSVQMVIGNALEPKMLGEGMELHPVVILLALAFWGLLWGVMGMVLAVPLTSSIRIVLMQFDAMRPIGDLLAGKLPTLAADAPGARAVPPER